jgi:hypothetical protein
METRPPNNAVQRKTGRATPFALSKQVAFPIGTVYWPVLFLAKKAFFGIGLGSKSCEEFNRFLDRQLVVRSSTATPLGFFEAD